MTRLDEEEIMIQVAVLGYGTVGSGVVEVIDTNHDSILEKAGVDLNVKYILDLRDFPGDPNQEKIVHDYDIIVNDPDVQIVVEVMGGTEPAFTFSNARWKLARAYVLQIRSLLHVTVHSFSRSRWNTVQAICLRQAAAAVFRSSVHCVLL